MTKEPTGCKVRETKVGEKGADNTVVLDCERLGITAMLQHCRGRRRTLARLPHSIQVKKQIGRLEERNFGSI